MSNTVFCTCGKEVQVRTDKRIAKHVSGERLKRGLLVLDRCKMSEVKITIPEIFGRWACSFWIAT